MFMRLIILAAILLVVLPAHITAQETRIFPLPEGVITDFTGTLSESDIGEIMSAIENAYSANSMDGHVIIAQITDEWYLDEYVKDYADYLQGKGLINPSGWLIYVSIDDRKFGIAVQDTASGSFSPPRKAEIELIMSERLEDGDVKGAVLDAITAITNLDTPSGVGGKKKFPPEMFLFGGVAIIVVVMMLRLRKSMREKSSD